MSQKIGNLKCRIMNFRGVVIKPLKGIKKNNSTPAPP